MTRKIGVVTVARSDYGHLKPLLAALRATKGVELGVLAGGTHLSPRFGRTLEEIERDGWPIVARLDQAPADDSPGAIAAAAGAAVAGFSGAFARWRPDILVVLGDRLEMLAAATAALPHTIPVAHVHGGEVTEGVIDEQVRHAITKLAHLHFPAATEYAARVRQLGEQGWRIHRCGAPGLDRFRAMRFLPRAELGRRLGLAFARPTLLVTLHPVTLDPAGTERRVTALLDALGRVDADLVLTEPGADTGRETIVGRLRAFAAGRRGAVLAASLGDDVYASLLREAAAMVGNSSSGIIESPTFALPAVNIGDRQRGRVRARNVIDVGESAGAIAAGIRRALDPAFRRSLRGLVNPCGDGRAAPRIARVLRWVELGPRLLVKHFAARP